MIAAEGGLKPRELPQWLVERAAELEVTLDTQAARALISHVGDRQQRLCASSRRWRSSTARAHGSVRGGPGSARSAERKLWTLADALVGGDEQTATRALVELRQQGERVPGLLYRMVRRLRDALVIAEALAVGQPRRPGQDKACGCRASPRTG